MTAFKFPLGAAVVLLTSVPALTRQMEEQALAEKEKAENPPPYSAISAIEPIEAGSVIGRASYLSDENNYLVRYRDGGHSQVDRWIPQSGLVWDPRHPQGVGEGDAEQVINEA